MARGEQVIYYIKLDVFVTNAMILSMDTLYHSLWSSEIMKNGVLIPNIAH